MARITVPTSARLPSSLRIDVSNSAVIKILNRLSRPSLLSLVFDWLDGGNDSFSWPYLEPEGVDDDDPEELYPPAASLDDLRELYEEMQSRKGSKREVLDRILEGDWRQGLSLYQLAMADLQYLYDHPHSQKWSAYRIVPLKTPAPDAGDDEPPKVDKESLTVPRFHPSSFLRNLQNQVLPDVKAHYTFDRHKELPLLLLRIFILDSPYTTDLAAAAGAGGDRLPANFDSSRTVYIAFPDASPHIYISRSSSQAAAAAAAAPGEAKSLRSLVVEGVPKALSRPRERYALRPTGLAARGLGALLERRGAGRAGAAGGGWSVYAATRQRGSPLDPALPTPPLSERDGSAGEGAAPAPGDENAAIAPTSSLRKKRATSPATERDERAAKRARLVAQARFGDTARLGDGKGVERVDIVMEDPYPHSTGDRRRAEEEDDEPQAAARSDRRSAGGRRSGIDAAFDRERETREEHEEEADEDGPSGWRPGVRLTFHGTHVFAGIRQLVEHGIIDGEKMPGWMTGEEGVTIGVVRNGRIRGHKGSGL